MHGRTDTCSCMLQLTGQTPLAKAAAVLVCWVLPSATRCDSSIHSIIVTLSAPKAIVMPPFRLVRPPEAASRLVSRVGSKALCCMWSNCWFVLPAVCWGLRGLECRAAQLACIVTTCAMNTRVRQHRNKHTKKRDDASKQHAVRGACMQPTTLHIALPNRA